MQGNGLQLPFHDDCFDVASVAFGIRNIPDRIAALREMARVVVPGGMVQVLEMGLPRGVLLQRLHRTYLNHVLPRLARTFTPNPEAYHYLVDSIQDFPEPEAFARIMQSAGLRHVAVVPLTFGVAYLHTGRKPEDR
jgi:demethylmenaquinone methyltransferase/2-methoxy-6-polyprenyl-1,4-benzoquinol methylase